MGKMLRKWWCCLSSTWVDRCHTRNMEGLTSYNNTEHASYWRNLQQFTSVKLNRHNRSLYGHQVPFSNIRHEHVQSQPKWPTDILLLSASKYSEVVSVDL